MAHHILVLTTLLIILSSSSNPAAVSPRLDRNIPLHRFNLTFRSRMERDTQRAAYIATILLGEEAYHTDAHNFSTDIVPGFNGELFFVRAHIGTPPVTQLLLVDTGSDITWFQCLPCQHCYNQVDPIFQPASSSSFQVFSCESTQCQNLLLEGHRGCQENQCTYHIEYADGAQSKGELISENIALGDTTILGATMGCGRDNTGDFQGFDGILGLGRGTESLVQQINPEISGTFVYCLPNPWVVTSGWLDFGPDIIPNGRQPYWTTLLDNPLFPSFYYVRLSAIYVGQEKLQLPDGIFDIDTESGRGGVIMDSGTVVTWFPQVVYEALRDSFVAQTRDIPRATPSPFLTALETCYNLTSEAIYGYKLPLISLQFDAVKLDLGHHAILIKVDNNYTYCLAFKSSPFPHTIIGNTQQAGVQITYDTINKIVWFGPDTCQ